MLNFDIDKKKYGGKYVATETFTSRVVLAAGKDPIKVYELAVKKGISEPVINYIHKEGVVCLY